MPGVVVTTNVRSGPSDALRASSGQFFLVGQFERGDTTKAVRLRSLSELQRNFGGRVTYSDAFDQLYTYFAEGGEQAYVSRVVGPAATSGSVSLMDRNNTPAATLKVDAASAGAWSSNVTVEVQDGPITNTFRMIVRLNGDVVEDYNNITSPADAVNKFASSAYIKVTNLGSASTAPANNPAVVTATSLTAGVDDRTNVNVSTYVTGLTKFVPELGDGAVAIPGQTGATIYSALDAHAKANNRVALLASAKGDSVATLQSTAASLNSEYCGLFAPWVVIPGDAGTTKTISPEGYVAGCRARAHSFVGPWRAPAGAFAVSRYVTDLSQTFSASDADLLDTSKVSVVRKVANTVRLYGWRSTSNDLANWRFLKDRDLLNRIVVSAQAALEDYVYEPIDNKGHLLAVINARLVGLVDPIAQADGLFGSYADDGSQIDPGYKVNTGTDINTVSTLAQNRIVAEISVRPSPTAALINLTITKVNLLSAL